MYLVPLNVMMADVSLTATPLKEKHRSISPSSRTSIAKKSGSSDDDDLPMWKMPRRITTNSRWTLAMAREVERVERLSIKSQTRLAGRVHEAFHHISNRRAAVSSLRGGGDTLLFQVVREGLLTWRPMAVVGFRDVKSDHVHSIAPTLLPLVGKRYKDFNNKAELTDVLVRSFLFSQLQTSFPSRGNRLVSQPQC